MAFLFVEDATRSAGALAAMKPWSGVIGEDGVEIQRVGLVRVEDGSFAQVTPANLHVYEFNWSPDSSRLAYVAANPPGENNWWVAQLYTQPVVSGQPRSILDPQPSPARSTACRSRFPRWSDDGKQIAFIGGLMSDQGSTGGDIWVVPLHRRRTEEPHPQSSLYARLFRMDQRHHPRHLRARRRQRPASSSITSTPTPTTLTRLSTFPESIGAGGDVMSVSVANNGDIAIVRRRFDRAPEVWAGPLKNLKQITHINDGLTPAWGKTENIEWTNDGFHVQGWLLYPRQLRPRKEVSPPRLRPRRPLRRDHATLARRRLWRSPFSALGYFVFMPNPRGSYGQGEKFTQANIKDFGYGDLRDILAGMDVLEKHLPIDKNREGLTGWSYGGFMTMFTVTQTTRFKAAVAGAGISDWKSYYGENSIDQWMLPFFGKTVYEDPAVYAKSSAIEFIKNVRTPHPGRRRRQRRRVSSAPELRVLARAPGGRRQDAARRLPR